MSLRIGLILPDLLGTYGDSGNAAVLAHRARERGHKAEVITVHYGEPIPDSLDLYTLGGGEDVAQSLAAAHLLADGGLARYQQLRSGPAYREAVARLEGQHTVTQK